MLANQLFVACHLKRPPCEFKSACIQIKANQFVALSQGGRAKGTHTPRTTDDHTCQNYASFTLLFGFCCCDAALPASRYPPETGHDHDDSDANGRSPTKTQALTIVVLAESGKKRADHGQA